jgi:hypothetical protein
MPVHTGGRGLVNPIRGFRPALQSMGFIFPTFTTNRLSYITETRGFVVKARNYPNFPGWRVERTNSRNAETFGP